MRKASVKEEIVRCAQDPVYFINQYVKIRHPKRGLIPFKTFQYQNDTIECFRKKRFNVILKPRQMGFTEVTSAFITWLMLFHPNQSILALATKAETAKQVVRRVRNALKNLPKWLLIADITTDNKTSIELANGSFVKSISKSADAGRSEALSLLVIDEAAHIEGFDEIWTGIRPTVSAGGRIIMLSTPCGVGNVFHRTYTDAVSKVTDWNPIRVEWWQHPEHISDLSQDPKTGKHTSHWFRNETKGMSPREIAQEYECEFLASGDTFFTSDLINYVAETQLDFGLEEGLQVYQEPVEGRRYVMGVDCATGEAFDRGAAHVFDAETMLHVAEFNAREKPNQFAHTIVNLGLKYNKALMVVENNAVGLAVLEHVKLLQYPNLFYSKKGAKAGDRLGDPGNAAEGSMGPQYVHGVMTLGPNRAFMLNKLEELIRTRAIRMQSQRFRSEMETFVWNNGRPEARGGRRDDLIMAAALVVWVRDNLYEGVYNTPDLTAAMIKAMHVSKTQNTQIHGASKNPEHVPVRAMGVFNTPTRPYVQQLPNGRYIDLMAEMGMFIPRKG
ncbi:MAG TPA: terminase family protein [Isosphaeraceae bacterium]|nr:terminase family protein [Isosphaeraceae bacterium]